MFTVREYPHGCFCWVDLSTPDADAAEAFYCGLLGWEGNAIDAGYGSRYTLFQHEGETVAGLAELPTEMGHIPPAWNSYVSVDDVAALMAPVEAAGGTISEPPFEVPGGGLIALIQDPDGAALGLMQAGDFPGAGLINTPGALCWNDVYTRARAQTQAFYEALFGWQTEEDIPGYYLFRNGGRANGGMLPMDAEMQEYFRPWWMVYFSVADIEAAAARVLGLGGQLIVPPHDAKAGRFLLLQDPTGAFCSLFQLNEPEPWQG